MVFHTVENIFHIMENNNFIHNNLCEKWMRLKFNRYMLFFLPIQCKGG